MALAVPITENYEAGFSPGSPRLKPFLLRLGFSGLKPGTSTLVS